MDLPQMTRVRQKLYDKVLIDLDSEVIRRVTASGAAQKIKPGHRIAIAVGSRGVANIARIARSTVEAIRRLGGEPFIVPAMGSHGGATAEGQIEVLASLGVTEAFCRCPILSSMEVVHIGDTASGMPVHVDRNAMGADGIIVINRIKKHTDFHGPIESGLMKMMCIGLGKRVQAELVHSYGAPGLQKYIPEVARVVLAKAPIILGVATLENGYEQTAEIVAIEPVVIEETEMRLLRKNRRTYPQLPFANIDVLVVEQMGKNISGTGMDTNILGRILVDGVPEPIRPQIQWIVTLSITPEAHGNAAGVGLADLITKRLAEAIDQDATNINTITSGFLVRGKTPMALPTDKEAIWTALSRLTPESQRRPRVVWIRDTLHVWEVEASAALVEEGRAAGRIEIVGTAHPMPFDASGTIVPLRFEGEHADLPLAVH